MRTCTYTHTLFTVMPSLHKISTGEHRNVLQFNHSYTLSGFSKASSSSIISSATFWSSADGFFFSSSSSMFCTLWYNVLLLSYHLFGNRKGNRHLKYIYFCKTLVTIWLQAELYIEQSVQSPSILSFFSYFSILYILRFSVVVTHWSRSTQLLYIKPG